MGKMSRISYLCETDNMKELIEEVGTELAQGFMLAHKEMRSKINDPAFSKLKYFLSFWNFNGPFTTPSILSEFTGADNRYGNIAF